MVKTLTKSQQALMRALEGFEIIGKSPSQVELAKIFGCTQPTMMMRLHRLRRKGYIRWTPHRYKSIKILIRPDK